MTERVDRFYVSIHYSKNGNIRGHASSSSLDRLLSNSKEGPEETKDTTEATATPEPTSFEQSIRLVCFDDADVS